MVFLEIGRVLNDAGISEKEALKALDLARKEQRSKQQVRTKVICLLRSRLN
jgi:hypothetical protein